ncbi:MAG: T9SS type A sorting domain-containing protein [Bacteroidales bacterium]|nr:T9SS type A sorting domain-containing protein [Bacteroidales bacterium]
MKKIFIFFMALAMISFVAKAQNTTVSDSIHANTTWSGDTVFVDADIVIDDDIVLTIDPGVVVIFNDFYKIDVQGTLIAEGTEAEMIYFTVLDTTGFGNDYNHTGWDGIEFDNDSGDMNDNEPSSFDFCEFSFAKETDEWYGGGVFYIYYYKDITITSSVFMYNYCDGLGGAIGIQEESEAFIDHCTFLYNAAEDGGGAISVGCYNSSSPTTPIIQNCHFEGNMCFNSGYYGGAAIKTSAYATTRIINNVIIDNHADGHGGGILASGYGAPFIFGNLIIGNTSGTHGAGIKVSYESSPYIANNTIIGNVAGYGGGGIHSGQYSGITTIVNNIIGNNLDSTTNGGNLFFALNERYFDLQNNDIEGGFDAITVLYGDYYDYGVYENNINEDPMFIDPMLGDFSVECGSAVLDAGTMIMGMPMYDVAGNPRINGMMIDMGAVETISNAMVTSDPENIAVDQGSDATFTVVAEMADAYLWQISEDFGATWTDLADGANYSGTNTDVLTVAGTKLSMNGDMFRCMVAGPCEDAPTNSAFLFVNSTANLNSTSSEVAIYPNPSNGIFTIQAQGNVEITNVNGQVIKTIDMNNVNSTKVDMTDFGSGIYFVRISSENTNTVQKIIVK